MYVNDHESQYGQDRSPRTRSSGCTWTSGANGADASTGGRVDPEPDVVLATVARHEETNPMSPGWSLDDLALAMSRLSVPFVTRSGTWSQLRADHDHGYYIVLQGDSDVFPSGCSGAFDGDHAIGIHPDDSSDDWLIDDPICDASRRETESVLERYATKFSGSSTIRYGVFTRPVPGSEGEMGPTFVITGAPIGKATTISPISIIPTEGSDWDPIPVGTVRNVYAVAEITAGLGDDADRYEGQEAYVVDVPDGAPGSVGLLLASACTYRAFPTGGDTTGDVAARDEQWRAWLLAGSPGSEEG